MNKNKIIELTLKEIKEIETLVTGFGELEQIPTIMFQLADAKVENIRNILNLLTDENVAVKKNEKITQESVEKIVIQESEDIANTEEIETVEEIVIPDYFPEIEKEETVAVEEGKNVVIQEPEEEKIEEEIELPIVLAEKTEEVAEVIEKKEEPKPSVAAEKKPEKKTTIGEKIIGKKSSVNEKLSEKVNTSLDKTLNNRKITDLKKSISLNDKFRFQKELFKGNASLMNQTLEILNEAEDKNDAMEYLSNFEWDEKNQNTIDFMELVNRKFL